MQPILNVTIIAGAREPLGFAKQCIAGLFGGWAFMYQRKPQKGLVKLVTIRV
jgi:hypothetical protein